MLAKHVFPCSLCGGTDFAFIAWSGFRATRTTVEVCRHCGLVCLNPRWDEAGYAAYYSGAYYSSYQSGTAPPRIDDRGRRIASAMSTLAPDASILEIGAGCGANLLALASSGNRYELAAIEVDSAAGKMMRTTLPSVTVFTGTLAQYQTETRFDGIIMSHVLEHFVDPARALMKARSFLKPNGRLLVLVPDIDITLGYLKQFTTPHTHYFSRVTLPAMLERNGFAVSACTSDDAEIVCTAALATSPKSPVIDPGEFRRRQARSRLAWLTGWPNQVARRIVEALYHSG